LTESNLIAAPSAATNHPFVKTRLCKRSIEKWRAETGSIADRERFALHVRLEDAAAQLTPATASADSLADIRSGINRRATAASFSRLRSAQFMSGETRRCQKRNTTFSSVGSRSMCSLLAGKSGSG
jgi:hypothetical protein